MIASSERQLEDNKQLQRLLDERAGDKDILNRLKEKNTNLKNGEFISEDGKFMVEDASSSVPNEREEDIMGSTVVICCYNWHNICCWG